MEKKDTNELNDHPIEDNQEKVSRPKRAKRAPKIDDDFVYSLRENQSARTCEASRVKEESNMKKMEKITKFYTKVRKGSSPDYKPSTDLKMNYNLKKANIGKRKRDTESGLDIDDKVTLNYDTHVGKSNDNEDSPFSAQSKEHYNTGFNASNDGWNNEISLSEQKTRSTARRRIASTVGPADGKHISSRSTTQVPMTSDLPRKGRTTYSRKCKLHQIAQSPPRNLKRNYTVIIEWLGFYSDEESDQEDVGLINKRSERRKKLKMLENRNYRNETLHHQSSSSGTDVHESCSHANPQGNGFVFGVGCHTGKENISPEDPGEPSIRMCAIGSKLQGNCKLPSPDGATRTKSEALMEAAPKSESVDTFSSYHFDLEDVIEISD